MSTPSFVVNESLFVLDMDDTSERELKCGERLADGIVIGEERERGEQYTFYVSEDGRFDILAASSELATRWVQDGYLQKQDFQPHYNAQMDIDCYLLISPASLILTRLTDARAYGSSYYAHMLAAAMWHSRLVNHDINLRDGILCELYGVVLPTYTLTPKVADVALFANVLRGQYDSEDIRSPSDFIDGLGGLNRMTFQETLKKFSIAPDTIEPYFQCGEFVDDFVQLGEHASICGPLYLCEHFQIFSTSRDSVLLVMEESWAEQLIERNLLLQMDLKSVQLGRQRVKVLAFSRRKAVESVCDRHHGITQSEAFDFALALQRARRRLPEACFKKALYVQELGLLLPVQFEGSDDAFDETMLVQQVGEGPFAQGPFLQDVLASCIAIAKLK